MRLITDQQQATAKAVFDLAITSTTLDPFQLLLLSAGLIEKIHLLPEIEDVNCWSIQMKNSAPAALHFSDGTSVTFN